MLHKSAVKLFYKSVFVELSMAHLSITGVKGTSSHTTLVATLFINISTYSNTRIKFKNKLILNGNNVDQNKIQNSEKLKLTSSSGKT